ncbi:hypothetical protein [Singulisphaera sp. PoT]|uniref:hypothetical protein n=1 Tax=Singulisphaera sp. PoT TaxID=3411797 RepID=UPI003BF52484
MAEPTDKRSEIEVQHRHDLARALDQFNAADVRELSRRFGPGTRGMHELWDRLHVLNDNWHDFVVEHPACLLDPELYEEASRIGELIGRLYQRAGQMDTGASTRA